FVGLRDLRDRAWERIERMGRAEEVPARVVPELHPGRHEEELPVPRRGVREPRRDLEGGAQLETEDGETRERVAGRARGPGAAERYGAEQIDEPEDPVLAFLELRDAQD